MSVLGTGNSSTVYLAEHLTLKVYRAIKYIPKTSESITSQCLEANLLKNLNHPGIPIIYDIEEDKNAFYMIEEYIQGESLDTFVHHQSYISQELIIKFGIQLCSILVYLHKLMPYPILYQDLKPEHIILCGDQLKLIDFGIASFFSGSYKHFQFYGTKEFAAPEVCFGTEATPLSDMYSLGKILCYLIKAGNTNCSGKMLAAIEKACAQSAADRYETIADLKSVLENIQKNACSTVSHLCNKIVVFGSKHGIGATHVAISLVSILNQNGIDSIYLEKNSSDSLRSMIRANHFFKEDCGICFYKFFQGIPNYGPGIEIPTTEHRITVTDCGVYSEYATEPDIESFILFVIGGSDWDTQYAIPAANSLKSLKNFAFLCNYGNHRAAKTYAKLLNRKVYCFPSDVSAFTNSAEKEKLFFTILPMERSRKKFLPFIKKH